MTAERSRAESRHCASRRPQLRGAMSRLSPQEENLQGKGRGAGRGAEGGGGRAMFRSISAFTSPHPCAFAAALLLRSPELRLRHRVSASCFAPFCSAHQNSAGFATRVCPYCVSQNCAGMGRARLSAYAVVCTCKHV